MPFHDVIVSLTGATTTTSGLRVKARLGKEEDPTHVQTPDEQMKTFKLRDRIDFMAATPRCAMISVNVTCLGVPRSSSFLRPEASAVLRTDTSRA